MRTRGGGPKFTNFTDVIYVYVPSLIPFRAPRPTMRATATDDARARRRLIRFGSSAVSSRHDLLFRARGLRRPSASLRPSVVPTIGGGRGRRFLFREAARATPRTFAVRRKLIKLAGHHTTFL